MTAAHPDAWIDALPDGVVVADADGLVTAVSSPALRLFGLKGSGDSYGGRPLAEVLRLQDREGRDWVGVNCPYGGLRTRSAVPEQSWLLPDGTEVLVTARLLRERRMGPVTTVALVLRPGRGRARLDRERSDLVATVAHELRSPLTGVKGFVQALLQRWDRLTDDQKKLMLTTVSADADRLNRLIVELLDVARLDTGRLQLYPRPVALPELAHRVADSVRQGTARAIEVSAADDVPQVLADPDKVTQVITNLVENAVRHGDGAVRVRLERWPLEGAPDGARVIVTDQGEGIAAELRRRVFTKFWTGGARGGSGLGLYIVGGLVRAHGGSVTIADAPGGGAMIVTTWPGLPADLVDG